MEAVHNAGHTGKRIVITNRFEAVTCQACGRRVARKSRQQKFCSDRCRDYARRENNARGAIKNSVLGQDTGQPTNPPKSASKNNSLQAAKTASSIPLNVLGGYRWANSTTVEREVLRKIVRAEIGAAP
jgi:adenine-specific DNA methylase